MRFDSQEFIGQRDTQDQIPTFTYNGTPVLLLRKAFLIFGAILLLLSALLPLFSEQAARPEPRAAGPA